MHIEYVGSREGIRKAKMEIVEGMSADGQLLLNGDNDLLRNLEETPVQPVTYFGSDADCGVQAMNVRQEPGLLCFDVRAGEKTFPVEMALEGEHFVSDALAAVAVGLKMEVSVERIQQALAAFQNMAGRQEIFEKNGYTIIKDCYNAGPESMAAALNVLSGRKGRKIAVLGDMLELGDCAPAEHEKLGALAARKADLIFAYGPNAVYVAKGSGGKALVFDDHAKLAENLKAAAQKGDVILFKGSRGMHMEYSLEHFLK